MRIKPYLFLFLLTAITAFNSLQAAYQTPVGLHQQVVGAKKEVQMLYKNLFTERHFEGFGLTKTDNPFDFNNNSELTLRLIEWLEQRDDVQSKQLLTSINKLFYLKLHQLLSHVATKNITQKSDQSSLLVRNLRIL